MQHEPIKPSKDDDMQKVTVSRFHAIGSNLKTLHLLVAGILVAMFVMGFLMHKRIQALELTSDPVNPPIVIIDFAQLVSLYPEGASPEEVEALMVRTNEAIFALQESGLVVLDANAVLAAPTELYLESNTLFELGASQ